MVWFLRLEDDELVPRAKPRLTERVDIKTEGNYIVAPPSIHPSGHSMNSRYPHISGNTTKYRRVERAVKAHSTAGRENRKTTREGVIEGNSEF